jgi:hydroxymethylpyrimidine kinase/phosphomethylpyrimidine kinase
MSHGLRSNQRKDVPCALTIAGSDSGGGAGIQADLKTFAALGVHGISAITAVTAQNPSSVRRVEPISDKVVIDQIDAATSGFEPGAIKTGMLFNREIIRAVAYRLKSVKAPVVVDPVMISTSVAVLLEKSAIRELLLTLLPLATLVTPNLPESEFLLKRRIHDPEQMRAAARELNSSYYCAVLVKGGHLKSAKTAVDVFYDGDSELLLESPFIKGVSTHGTGCTYSAAITAYLALGKDLKEAVIKGKEFISNAIASSWRCGKHDVLNSFWKNSCG